MAKKTQEASVGLPAKFDPEASYSVMVRKPFEINKFRIQGKATLRGDVAEKWRDNLASAKRKE